MRMWEKRRIGQTNLEVTVLGFGTATLGGSRIPVTREESEAMIRAAWDAGIRYVDTAPFYGVGAAERRVGDAMRDRPRDAWVLSTKVGRLLRPRRGQEATTDGRLAPLPFTVEYDYSYDAIMRSVEDSYQRLGLDKIDILYVHDIGAYQHEEKAVGHTRTLRESGYRALTQLKSSGVISAIGIGVNEKEILLECLTWGDWDVFLLAGRYTLLEQGPLDDLLPECVRRGTSIVIGGPLNSGILAGRDTWNYAPAPAEVKQRVRRISEISRSPRRAAAGGRLAISTGASGCGRNHTRAARGGGVAGEHPPPAPTHSSRAVVGLEARRPVASGRPGAGVTRFTHGELRRTPA